MEIWLLSVTPQTHPWLINRLIPGRSHTRKESKRTMLPPGWLISDDKSLLLPLLRCALARANTFIAGCESAFCDSWAPRKSDLPLLCLHHLYKSLWNILAPLLDLPAFNFWQLYHQMNTHAYTHYWPHWPSAPPTICAQIKQQMLYASQRTVWHLDQLEQKGDLMGNHPNETEAEKTLINIIVNIYTKGFSMRSNKLYLDWG